MCWNDFQKQFMVGVEGIYDIKTYAGVLNGYSLE